MRMRFASESGLTLLEVLIALLISTAISGLLVSILINNSNVYYHESSAVAVNINLNDITAQMGSDIKQSLAVASGYPVASPTYTSNATTLVLKLASLSNTGIIDNTYDYIVYYKDPTNPAILKRQIFVDPASTRIASTKIVTTILQTVTFRYLDNSGAAVASTASVKVGVDLVVNSKMPNLGSARSASIVTYLENR
jgi:Tfp pilus assembly major pilin PilA